MSDWKLTGDDVAVLRALLARTYPITTRQVTVAVTRRFGPEIPADYYEQTLRAYEHLGVLEQNMEGRWRIVDRGRATRIVSERAMVA